MQFVIFFFDWLLNQIDKNKLPWWAPKPVRWKYIRKKYITWSFYMLSNNLILNRGSGSRPPVWNECMNIYNMQLKGFSILSASIIYLTLLRRATHIVHTYVCLFTACWLHFVNELHYLPFIWMQCIYTLANLAFITFFYARPYVI